MLRGPFLTDRPREQRSAEDGDHRPRDPLDVRRARQLPLPHRFFDELPDRAIPDPSLPARAPPKIRIREIELQIGEMVREGLGRLRHRREARGIGIQRLQRRLVFRADPLEVVGGPARRASRDLEEQRALRAPALDERAGGHAGLGGDRGERHLSGGEPVHHPVHGREDLFVAGYGSARGIPTVEDVAGDYLGTPTDADRDRLYRNRGDGTFEDVTKAAGLYRVLGAMALNFGDLDNDGWLDFYTGTGTPDLGMLVPNRMFRNDGGKRFQDVTTAGNFGHLQKGHAIAFGDYDNDGDQDVVEQMGGAYLGDTARTTLYRNPGPPGRSIGIELEGVRSNRRGVGARLELLVETAAGRRSIHRTVTSGGSFGGNPMRQEIGLGEAARIAWLEVRWPATGQKQRVTGLEPGRRYLVREGQPKAEEVVWPGLSPRGASAASRLGRR